MLVKLYGAVRAWLKLLHLKWTVLWVTTAVTLNSFFTQTRMSHENGIGAKGHLKIVDDPRRPTNDFLIAGYETDCRVRFGAATWKDDAKLVIRGAALKFADTRFDSPFDLMMNTGRRTSAKSNGSCRLCRVRLNECRADRRCER